MEWYNEPARWSAPDGTLRMHAEGGTDFWRITHYGFTRDNGHLCYERWEGGFVATVQLTGAYRDRYDQAGLMLRLDERNWIKTGIEFVDGVQHVSAVVTRDFSDWSVTPLPVPPASIRLRLMRKGDFVEIGYAAGGADFAMLRLAYFPPAVPVQIGMMAAAPDGPGFTVLFEGFSVERLRG